MSDRHALPDSDAIWRDTGSGTFLRVGSVVPTSVLAFTSTGVSAGLIADPSVTPPEIAAWAKQELAHIPDWEPGPDPVSPHCGHRIPKVLPCGTKLTYLCTEPMKHSCAPHEARGLDAEVFASAPVRKPSPKPRKVAS